MDLNPNTALLFIKKWATKGAIFSLFLFVIFGVLPWGCGIACRTAQKEEAGTAPTSLANTTPAPLPLPAMIMVKEPVEMEIGPTFGTRINHDPRRYIKWDVVEGDTRIQFRFANGELSPWLPIGSWSGKEEQRTLWRFSYDPHRHAPFQVRTEKGEATIVFGLRPPGWRG